MIVLHSSCCLLVQFSVGRELTSFTVWLSAAPVSPLWRGPSLLLILILFLSPCWFPHCSKVPSPLFHSFPCLCPPGSRHCPGEAELVALTALPSCLSSLFSLFVHCLLTICHGVLIYVSVRWFCGTHYMTTFCPPFALSKQRQFCVIILHGGVLMDSVP